MSSNCEVPISLFEVSPSQFEVPFSLFEPPTSYFEVPHSNSAHYLIL